MKAIRASIVSTAPRTGAGTSATASLDTPVSTVTQVCMTSILVVLFHEYLTMNAVGMITVIITVVIITIIKILL